MLNLSNLCIGSAKFPNMKKFLLFTLLFSTMSASTKAQTIPFAQYPVYDGTDLGLTYTALASSFRIWAPLADSARILFYAEGVGGDPLETNIMLADEGGTWIFTTLGDLKGRFYVFQVKRKGKWSAEVPDPYARAVGVNGKRAQVIDLSKTNPTGWSKEKSPAFQKKTDAVLYELQVRDASIHSRSGVHQKGKYLGLTEKKTRNAEGLSTGLDHIRDLGVTHVHLLPSFDFYSIDESRLGLPQYNWGYDPLNYNTPDGSFSQDPFDGMVRIREFKQLVKSFHQNGLRVVMDVVYNHTRLTENSYFNELVPGYYYRQNDKGQFSNATACGNEIASERHMVRKFILESVLYWVNEYHIDGFRFDLMGVHDIKTMNLIAKELHRIRPDILIYGEGWTAGASPLPDDERALKANVSALDRIAVFSDDIRDGIKGSVFEHENQGFVNGNSQALESIKFGVVAACQHPQVNYAKVNYSKAPYATEPFQTVTYCECHDNHVLWDKLKISAPDKTTEERKDMHKLALTIVLTSQGISFLHAGTEFLRSKKGVENSFDSPDSTNAIDWGLKTTNKDVFEYVKRLIKMRRTHPAFRMESSTLIREHLHFLDNTGEDLLAYTINGAAVGDKWKRIMVIYSGANGSKKLTLPPGKWKLFIRNNQLVKPARISGEVEVKASVAWVLYEK